MIARVRAVAAQRLLFLPHAVRQMSRPDRMITPADVASAIRLGEVLEDYPSDARGHSCLVLGYGVDGRPIHIVCAPKVAYLAVITAYIPDPDHWSSDFRTRL